jgi:adenylosuccinate synthase
MARVTLTCGLSFGDEGKGTFVDWLSRGNGRRRATLVVRYNGGAQAAHNVVDGARHHTFAQWGSGTFVGVPTLLSRHVLVNPVFALAEAKMLAGKGVPAMSLLHVERGAAVTTPFHVAMNRLRECARSQRHGSCGMGIGETMQDIVEDRDDVLRVGDLEDPVRTRRLLQSVRARKLAAVQALDLPSRLLSHHTVERELALLADPAAVDFTLERFASFAAQATLVGPELLARTLREDGHVVFEGAQGVLLDQDMGFQPYTTWTDITFRNAAELLTGFSGPVTRLGVLRAYATRHGAGPMVTAMPSWDRLSSHDHNQWGEWQGSFRSGPLDLVATRYALQVLGGVDGLLLSNLDRLAIVGDAIPVCHRYDVSPGPLWDADGGIRVVRPCDLTHQEELTRSLANLRPLFKVVPRGDYADEVAAALGVSLVATSTGPEAAHKRLFSYRNEERCRIAML